MAPGVRGRKLSFEILSSNTSGFEEETTFHRSKSDPSNQVNVDSLVSESKPTRRKRKNKNSKKKNFFDCAISEDSIDENGTGLSDFVPEQLAPLQNGNCTGLEVSWRNCRPSTIVYDQIRIPEEEDSSSTVHSVGRVSGHQNLQNSDGYSVAELRQRISAIGNGEVVGTQDDQNGLVLQGSGTGAGEDQVNFVSSKHQSEHNGPTRKLDTAESLDWKQLLEQDANHSPLVEKSPLKYFMEEMYGGHSLRSTTTSGNDKERERVYDTMFRLPWRCELLIDFGFLVCLDSFLSLLTIMPTRMLVSFWRFLRLRKFERPSVAELSDFGCFIALVCGVGLLQQTDISLIYHMIRGQGTVKLYVVYNILEIFDKLCQSFGGEVLQTLFNSAEGLANCSPENMGYWTWRFILDETLTLLASNILVHSFVLLAQAITLSTCIVAHNNALLALLVSNNFAEIKSNVFKRFSKDNIQSMVYFDSVERFHILAFLLFVLAQNILEAEGPWFETFVSNALTVYFCEMIIDIIKHSFIAKFNDIKPITYSEFLEDLCKQTLNIKAENEKRSLTFIPLAPACVVIRVVSPVYAAHLPYGPLAWRVFWMLILYGMTFVMLVTLKLMIGMGLERHARWYIKRCQKRKLHSD